VSVGPSSNPAVSAAPSASPAPSAPPSATPRPTAVVLPSESLNAAPSASLTLVNVAVAPCTVTDGAVEGPAPTPAVRFVDVHVPADLAGELVIYGIENEHLILAPRNWRCTGLVGADGSAHITIVDPADERAAITVDAAPGAPYAGVLDLACPLFADAERELQATFGFACPKTHVQAEQVTFAGTDIARYHDPAGVKSVGALSGGPYAVDGALIYHTQPDNVLVAFQISCALKPADAAACGPIVDDWVARVAQAYGVAQ
jgi:hypothetical protein